MDFSCNDGISIIIAIRNGELSLSNLIHYLKDQDYKGEIEFLLIDDESDDRTAKIILDTAAADNRFKYYSSTEGNKLLNYKKKALDVGIQNANFNKLLFTDVDCLIPATWASTMSNYFSNGYDYLVGPSIVDNNNKVNNISRFQRIDFLLLMIICRASTYFGNPLASSGQNQGFTKELYLKVGGFIKVNSFIGDDTVFLQYCTQMGAKSNFVNSRLAIICSRKELKITNFISQRIRWVADANKLWKLNPIFFSILFLTFIFYISFPILIIYNLTNYLIIILILSIKILNEYCLLYIGSKFFSTKINIYEFLLWQIFHVPYIILVGVMSYFIRYFSWKERRLN
jgi:glycosyltransferase involved in cell wall biosynthesis